MEGLADVYLRRLLTAQGGFDWVVSEFVRVVDRVYPDRVFYNICPELQNGGKTDCGTPIRVQLLGNDVDAMAENARLAVKLGSYGIDINFQYSMAVEGGIGPGLLQPRHAAAGTSVGEATAAEGEHISVSQPLSIGRLAPNRGLVATHTIEQT